jgi:hypothetical protein
MPRIRANDRGPGDHRIRAPPTKGSQKWEPTQSAASGPSATQPECSRRLMAPHSTQSDSDRHQKRPWTSLTRKRSLVQIQYGPPRQIPRQTACNPAQSSTSRGLPLPACPPRARSCSASPFERFRIGPCSSPSTSLLRPSAIARWRASRGPLRACCYRSGSAAAARSRATDPAMTRARPAAILGLRRCTARAIQGT